MFEGNAIRQPADDVNTTIEFVFREKPEKVDISTPEGLATAKELLEKGKLYNAKMHDMGDKEKKAKNWEDLQNLIEMAKEDESAKKLLVDTFKTAGIELESSQEFEDDVETDVDKVLKQIQVKMDKIEQKVDVSNMSSGIREAHSKLSQKYNGKDGKPSYDAEVVIKWAEENRMFIDDPLLNYEQAYKLLNSDKILEAEIQKGLDDKTKRKDKRDRAFVETGDEGTVNVSKQKLDIKGKSMAELAAQVAEETTDEDFYIGEG